MGEGHVWFERTIVAKKVGIPVLEFCPSAWFGKPAVKIQLNIPIYHNRIYTLECLLNQFGPVRYRTGQVSCMYVIERAAVCPFIFDVVDFKVYIWWHTYKHQS